MSNPYSRLTKIRFALVRWLDPYPDKGEAWCVDCELNDGKTLILNAAGHADHLGNHRDTLDDRKKTIAIRANYGYIPAESEDP